MLTICKGICGLGNRLLFLAEAIQRCQANRTNLFVLWNDYMYSDDPAHNVFYDAFEINATIDAGYRQLYDIPAWKTQRTEPSLWQGKLDRDIYRLSPKFRDLRRATAIAASMNLTSDREIEVVFGAPPAYQRPRNLVRIRNTLTAHVTPTKKLARLVDSYFKRYLAGQPTLGIHVRASAANKRKIHLGSLWKKLDKYIAKTPNARVFLATDAWDIQDLFQSRLGSQLIVREKWMARASSDDNRAEENSLHKRKPYAPHASEPSASKIFWDAVVELFLLSRCDTLYYQHNSSFSVIASLYAKRGASSAWGKTEPTVDQFSLEQSIASAIAPGTKCFRNEIIDGSCLTSVAPLRATGLSRAPARLIVQELSICRQLFQPRSLRYSQDWYSIDIIRDSKWTAESVHFNSFVQWLKQQVPWMPNRAYLAILQPRGEIAWHSDYSEKQGFSKGFILGLHCPKGSFIEFLDAGKYTYAPGASYYAKLGLAHRVVNRTHSPRYTAFIGSPAQKK
jgi:hypothetical protein